MLGTGTGLRIRKGIDDATAGHTPNFWAPKNDFAAIAALLLSSPVNLLLVLVPLGFLAPHFGWGATTIFCLV